MSNPIFEKHRPERVPKERDQSGIPDAATLKFAFFLIAFRTTRPQPSGAKLAKLAKLDEPLT